MTRQPDQTPRPTLPALELNVCTCGQDENPAHGKDPQTLTSKERAAKIAEAIALIVDAAAPPLEIAACPSAKSHILAALESVLQMVTDSAYEVVSQMADQLTADQQDPTSRLYRLCHADQTGNQSADSDPDQTDSPLDNDTILGIVTSPEVATLMNKAQRVASAAEDATTAEERARLIEEANAIIEEAQRLANDRLDQIRRERQAPKPRTSAGPTTDRKQSRPFGFLPAPK